MTQLDFLKTNIHKNMPLSEILNTFRKILKEEKDESTLCYIAETIMKDDKKVFCISFVRKFLTEDEESYLLICVDVIYKSDENTDEFYDDLCDENELSFFPCVKCSRPFKYAEKQKIEDLEIYIMEE